MLMVLGVDMGVGWHVKVKVEPIFVGVKYKKRRQLVPPLIIIYSISIRCIKDVI